MASMIYTTNQSRNGGFSGATSRGQSSGRAGHQHKGQNGFLPYMKFQQSQQPRAQPPKGVLVNNRAAGSKKQQHSRPPRPNKLSWFSYNQEPGQYSDNEPDHQGREELTLQPLRLEAATDLDEADEVEPLVVGSPDSALTETVWLSPTSEDLVPEAAADLHLLQQRQQDQQPLRHHQQRLNHFESGGGGGRKSGGRKGLMGKGKSHHGRGPQDGGGGGGDPGGGSSIINMDPDSNWRTHMLFPGGGGSNEDGNVQYGRASGSPSFMKSVFGAGWGRRTPGGIGAPQPPGMGDPRFRMSTPEMDPFLRGAKQVSFEWEKPERKPNSYNADSTSPEVKALFSVAPPPPSATSTLQRQSSCDPQQSSTLNGTGPPSGAGPPGLGLPPGLPPGPNTPQTAPAGLYPPGVEPRLRPPPSGAGPPPGGPGPSGTAPDGRSGSLVRSASMDPRPPGGAPPRARGPRPPMTREEAAMRAQEEGGAVRPHQHFQKDCFIIPQESVERFLPDGVALPRNPRTQLINILEVDDPKLAIVFHMMPPLSPLNPHLESPLSSPMERLRSLAEEEMVRCKELNVDEGFLLKNLEKDSEYPYINYFVIHKTRAEATALFKEARAWCYDHFDPEAIGYHCAHTFDKYDEVATIARPPYEPLSKRPTADTTGYIVCMYRVFKGDDGQKFERNWLYWTGARMLYKNLPRGVGLRRITLHKSLNLNQEVVYFLLVECSHFMDHIGEAANLLPILRARICGYTGIFRCVQSF